MQATTPNRTSSTTILAQVGTEKGQRAVQNSNLPLATRHLPLGSSIQNPKSKIQNHLPQYLIVDSNGKGHLPVRDTANGPLNHHLMGAAWAALHGGYRGNKYEGPDKQKAIEKLKALYRAEGMPLPSGQYRDSGFGVRVSGPETQIPNTEPRFVVALSDVGAGAVRIPLAITGKWARDAQQFSITEDDLEEIVRNFAQRKNGEINVDYDHASEMPEVAAGGPIPSAGRVVKLDTPEELRDSGFGVRVSGPETRTPKPEPRFVLYGTYEPTDRARALIKNREYRYISPAIDWGAKSKQTGKPQGTTLTSVALTNRPFLEELPQIRLSDPSYQLVDVGDVHVDSSLGSPEDDAIRDSGLGFRREGPRASSAPKSKPRIPEPGSSANPETRTPKPGSQTPNPDFKGGHMKQVKLSVEDGKVRVAHDDFGDAYYADPEEMKQCLDDLGFGPAEGGEAPDESVAEEIRDLAGMPAPEDGGASAQPVATLSECVAALRRRLGARAEISLAQAGTLLSESEAGGKFIAAADYFRWRVEQELDQAVKSGKVLPRQRDDWRKIALSDFPTFRKIVAEQKPQVPLRPVGLAGAGPEDPQAQVKLLAEQRMRERRISFGQALSEIGREQPELVHQYRRAVSGGE